MTVGTGFEVPEPEQVLVAVVAAGYRGIELGPPGYLGEGEVLHERLATRGLEIVGGFVPIRFSEPDYWDSGLSGLYHTLDLFRAAGASGAHPVLCDAGGPDRMANPGRGGEDASLRLDAARWHFLVEGVKRAADAARHRGFEPVFHHHTATYVEALSEIERFLSDTDVPLLLDSGHLAMVGGDPVTALRDWSDRIVAIHIKDARLDVLKTVRDDRADMLTAWRRGVFCALGDGDVDIVGFCHELNARTYEGWVVVEQDRVLENERSFADAVVDQQRNRRWLNEHAGW